MHELLFLEPWTSLRNLGHALGTPHRDWRGVLWVPVDGIDLTTAAACGLVESEQARDRVGHGLA